MQQSITISPAPLKREMRLRGDIASRGQIWGKPICCSGDVQHESDRIRRGKVMLIPRFNGRIAQTFPIARIPQGLG